MDAVQFARFTPPAMIESSGSGGKSEGFSELVKEGFDRLQELEDAADDQVRRLISGEPVELHRVILAGEEAGLAFELMTSVRNKLVDAYQEVMRMQV